MIPVSDHVVDDEAAVLVEIRERLVAAENAGDPGAFEQLLADDAVIMPPNVMALEGKTACLEFIRSVMADVKEEFASHQITFRSAELIVTPEIAIDRGTFVHRLTPNTSELHTADCVETGCYLWIHMRAPDRTWRVSRMTGTITQAPELVGEGTS